MADRKFTDLELERLLAGDLPAARASEIEANATTADRTRLDELRAENSAFLAKVDVAAEVRAIGKRMEKVAPEPRRLSTWWKWIVTGGALAAAAAALLLVIGRRTTDAPISDEDDLRVKGGEVSLIVHTPDRQLTTGDTVRPGDRLRFEVTAGEAGYVAVIGIDGTGVPTVYFPDRGTAAAPIDPAANRILPGAIELDATPGDETFYAVYGPAPFSIEAVLPSLQSGVPVPGVTSARVVLRKQLE